MRAYSGHEERGPGLRAVLRQLDLPSNPAILDLGAGGFAGTTTTTHLVDLFSTIIDAVEIHAHLAEGLSSKFGNRVNIILSDVRHWVPTHSYDLIVTDLDAPLIPYQSTGLLETLHPYLTSHGYYITVFIYDCRKVYDANPPLLNPSNRSYVENFLHDVCGKNIVSPEELLPFYEKKGFRVRGIVDKSLGSHNGIGWLVLQDIGGASIPNGPVSDDTARTLR